MVRKKVLVFCAYYLPGYKAGGPIRTISNMVELLGDIYEFYIVTGDRDAYEDKPYTGLSGVDGWVNVGKAKVRYLDPSRRSFMKVARIIRDTPHDVLYINSFFSFDYSIKPLVLRRLGFVPNKAVVLAPRGEFSEGALGLKTSKKKFFLQISKLLCLHQGVKWHVSSEREKTDLLSGMRRVKNVNIHTAINLPDAQSLNKELGFKVRPTGSPLRVVFLSRVHPMKNLDYAIDVLKTSGVPIAFDVYGLVDDEAYFARCLDMVNQPGGNMIFNYKGVIDNKDVINTLSTYDLFIFPTRGENYGHVVLEALTSGTPVLMANTTPWLDLEENQAGWVVPLEQKNVFLDKIKYMSELSEDQQIFIRQKAREYAARHLLDDNKLKENIDLFC